MDKFSAVTDEDLARAHADPAFRQLLLQRNLTALLDGIKRLRKAAPSAGPGVRQLREGVEFAVRLSEMIQNADVRRRVS